MGVEGLNREWVVDNKLMMRNGEEDVLMYPRSPVSEQQRSDRSGLEASGCLSAILFVAGRDSDGRDVDRLKSTVGSDLESSPTCSLLL
jgi:hypothetical protein